MRQRRVMELSPRSAEGGVERVFRAGVRRVRLAEAFWHLAIFGKFWIIKEHPFGKIFHFMESSFMIFPYKNVISCNSTNRSVFFIKIYGFPIYFP